ncbi:MAG: PKD domain-containing protein, partial [Deltaproteobacteria bacterium]|nr:PKD domain-containing protein [Deltaproteobacteria bacterium]
MTVLAKIRIYIILLFSLLFSVSVSTSQAQVQPDAGPDQTVNEGDTVTLDGSNSSHRKLIIGYFWQQTGGSPSVTLKNANKAKASFTAPQVGPAGTSLTFQLTVTYNFYGIINILTDTAIVNVRFVNNPPVADAGPNQTVDEGSAVTLNGSNSFDPDFGDTITYQWIQTGGNPTVTLNGANTATPSFTAPNVGPGGTSLTFELTVTDLGGLEDSDTTVINVSFVNQPPIADAGPNQTKGEETKVTLNGSNSSDPDDGIKSYRWSQTAGPKVKLSNDEAIKPTFTAPNVAGSKSLTFELTVTDFGGLKDTDTTVVNVTGDNDPPTADAGPDQTHEEE